MAVSRNNQITQGSSGSLGTIMFRQLRGKTIVSKKPKPPSPGKQSEQQRMNRAKFKAAAQWAKLMMTLPEKKAYYKHKAKKLKLPNAYTAAVCDYMRKGEIKEIDTRQLKGKGSNDVSKVIKIKVQKKDFAIQEAAVSLHYADGRLIENGKAIKKEKDFFSYRVTQLIDDTLPITIRITLGEHGMNMVMKELIVTPLIGQR